MWYRAHRFIHRYATVAGPPFSSGPHSLGPFQVFDRNTKRLQRDRAAAVDGGDKSRMVDYVRDEIADRLMERLLVRFRHVTYLITNTQCVFRTLNVILTRF
jgi:NADH dehydrogenase [ubiquinone] 1 alpha subcomplex assembly factor 5